jgi:hypothetical protein
MAIEAAKLEWRKSCTPEMYQRGSQALFKYQIGVQNFRWVGSVLFDSAHRPSDDDIRELSQIRADRGNKRIILFSVVQLPELVVRIFDLDWST